MQGNSSRHVPKQSNSPKKQMHNCSAGNKITWCYNLGRAVASLNNVFSYWLFEKYVKFSRIFVLVQLVHYKENES